jgi:hypothetical protein
MTPAEAPEVQAHTPKSLHSQGALPTEQLSFLTLNVQKAGLNSPSLVDLVSLLDLHTPYFVQFTNTPLLPSNGARTHILRNMGYKINYHPINAPSPQEILTDARLPDRLTHAGGGC